MGLHRTLGIILIHRYDSLQLQWYSSSFPSARHHNMIDKRIIAPFLKQKYVSKQPKKVWCAVLKHIKVLLESISAASTEHMELITNLSPDMFLLLQNRPQRDFWKWVHSGFPDRSDHLQSLGKEEDEEKGGRGGMIHLLWGLIKFGVAHWSTVGPQHTLALLFSDGKLVVGMMSPLMIVSNVKLM